MYISGRSRAGGVYKIFYVGNVGGGGRGAESYGRLFLEQKDKYRIVALCDLLPEKLEKYGEIFDVANENLSLIHISEPTRRV